MISKLIVYIPNCLHALSVCCTTHAVKFTPARAHSTDLPERVPVKVCSLRQCGAGKTITFHMISEIKAVEVRSLVY